MKQPLSHYLERYAEPEGLIAKAEKERFGFALVIPARNETPDFLAGYDAALRGAPGSVLLIVVVNTSEAEPESAANNLKLIQALISLGDCTPVGSVPGSSELRVHFWRGGYLGHGLLVVDRTRHPLPKHGGAGLARKIGADIALALFAEGKLDSRFMLHTDADATLPEDYFRFASPSPVEALHFGFTHVEAAHAVSPDVYLATLKYECQIRYHVLGMRHAGSSYAWHSLGSCLAVSAEAYAAVRGFPKRQAGEDFYLLDKIKKLRHPRDERGPTVVELEAPVIRLAARTSERAPFGTGPAVKRLLLEVPVFTDPRCYAALHKTLLGFQRFAETRTLEDLGWAWQHKLNTTPQHPDEFRAVKQIWSRLGVFAMLSNALNQSKTAADLYARIDSWFDGLKSLRFLHAVRDELYPAVPYAQALAQAPFTNAVNVGIGGNWTERDRWEQIRSALVRCRHAS